MDAMAHNLAITSTQCSGKILRAFSFVPKHNEAAENNARQPLRLKIYPPFYFNLTQRDQQGARESG
jgi:hypothetical protein